MVNLDMIGRMDSANQVYTNTVEANDKFSDVLDKIKGSHPNINMNTSSDSRFRGSDHTSFYNKNIPVISFTTGLHNAYHTPADTIGLINFAGEKNLLDFIYDFILKEVDR